MGIELLIYIYGAICLSMILFNCVCILVFRRSEQKLYRKSRALELCVMEQKERIYHGKPLDSRHIAYLNRRLSRVGNLMAFDDCLSRIFREDEQLAVRYLHEIRMVFTYLSVVYLKKEVVQTAYFAYLLAKYRVCRDLPFDAVIGILKEYLKKDSLYCRQNAMKALYSFGNEDFVAEGMKILQREQRFFHGKILTDGLLSFDGDHRRLIARLWADFADFVPEIQRAVLDYIRFKSGNYCAQMLRILEDDALDEELHYAAIRYFGKYPYPPAYDHLIRFVLDRDETRWSYAAFSAVSLAGYPGEQTVEALKQGLFSSSWYVRYNAAQSLDDLAVSYQDMMDVLSSNDRYAREMITYRFDIRRLHEEEREEAQSL